MLFIELQKVISLQKHIAEFSLWNAAFWVVNSSFYGFFAQHIIYGNIFPYGSEKIEYAHVFVEIIVIEQFKFANETYFI